MLPSWVRQLKKRFTRRGPVAPIRNNLAVEQLEDRSLLAVSIWTGLGIASATAPSADWTDSRNWQAGQVPGFNDDVIFPAGLPAAQKPPATGAGPTFAFPVNSNVDEDFVIRDLQINDSGYHFDAVNGAATLTITGRLLVNIPQPVTGLAGLSLMGPLFSQTVTSSNLSIRLTGIDQEFRSDGPGVLYITATLIDPPPSAGNPLGTGGLLKTGPGTIALNGFNTYSGVTRVGEGTLIAARSTALGSTIRGSIVDDGASMGLSGGSVVDSLEIIGSGVGGQGALVGLRDPLATFRGVFGGGGTWVGGITLTGNAAIGAASGDVAVDVNPISGSGTLSKVGFGDLSLFVANTYTGDTLIQQGSVTMFDNDALSPGFTTTVFGNPAFGATLYVAPGLAIDEVLFLNGAGRDSDAANRPLGALSLFSPGSTTWLGTITFSSNANVGATSDGTLILAGELLGGGRMQKVDRGNVRVARPNALFTGDTNVDNGTLEVADALALGTGTVRVNSTAGFSASVGTLQLEGTFTANQPLVLNGVGFGTAGAVHVVNPLGGGTSSVTFGGSLVLNSTSSVNVDAGASLTVSGVISDVPLSPAPGLEKTGSGTLILANNNTYTGATVLRGGTTVIQTPGALGATTGGTSVTSGAVLSVEGGLTITGESLNLSGSSTSPTPSTFRAASGNNVWTGIVNLISNGGTVAVDVAASATMEFNSVMSGDAETHKTGPGELKITGTSTNTNTGTIAVDLGTVSFNKTPGLAATNGATVVGTAQGAPGSAVLRLDAPSQIPDNRSVAVNASGLFNLNGFDETIGGATALTVAGGQVQTGPATLTLNGNVATFGNPATSSITGNLSLGNSTRTFNYLPTPAMQLSSNLNAIQFGQNLIFTFVATNNANEPAVTGQVKFFANGVQIGATQTLVGGTASITITTLPAGVHTITATYGGSSYYAPTAITLAPNQVVVNGPAYTLLTSSAVTAVPGQNVTFTYSIAGGAGAIAPTGTVTFFDGANQIGAPQPLSATGTASVSINTLTNGTHTITAVYSGDTFYASSTTTLAPNQVIGNQALVQLSTSTNAVTGTNDVTFSFQASGDVGQPTPEGFVTFFADGIQIGTPQMINPDGTATITDDLGFPGFPGFAVGSYLITAQYSGDDFYTPAVATLPVFQSADTPVVYQLTSHRNPGFVSDPAASPPIFNSVEFAFKADARPGDPVPTGDVRFFANGAPIGSDDLNANGIATFTWTTPTGAGTYTITAEYEGDFYYDFARVTLAGGERLQALNTTQYLFSNNNTSLVNQDVRFTFVAQNGTTLGTGSAQFFADGVFIGADTLTGGRASVTVDFLSVGPHTITAVYSGDANFSAGTFTLTPGQTVVAPLDAVLTSSADPAPFGTDVTFTFLTADAEPIPLPPPPGPPGPPPPNTGGATPTGFVTFFDGSNQIGAPQPLAADGTASITTNLLSIGSHDIRAVYSGDSNYRVLSVSLDDFQVIGPPPLLLINSSTDPGEAGESITFTITATGGAGQPTPTGNVRLFADGFPISGPISLKQGVATFTTADLPPGVTEITARYSGDSQYATAVATMTQNQLVIETPLVQFVSSANPALTGQNVTYTYMMTVPSSGSLTPTGDVQFFLNGVLVDTDDLDPFGSVTVMAATTFSIPTAGEYEIIAVYEGDENYEAISVTLFDNQEIVDPPLPPLAPPPSTAPRFQPQLTVNGPISGGPGAGLTTAGPGVLTLNAVNTYSGPTSLSGSVTGAIGTLILGGSNVLPDTPLTLGPAGVLDVNGKTDTVASLSGNSSTAVLALNGGAFAVGVDNTSTTFAGTITGNAASTLTKVGTGTLLLTGNSNTLAGTIIVNAGTLGGTGTVGPVVVNPGATLAPGLSPGVFTTGNVTFTTGSVFNVELNGTTPGTQYDQLVSTGTVALNNATLSVTLGFTPALNTTFSIITAAGGVTGTFRDLLGNVLVDGASFTSNNNRYQVDYTATGVDVIFLGVAAAGTLTSSVNPSSPGQNVSFTASYTSPAGPVTGTVDFFDGPTLIQSVALTGGSASTTPMPFTLGTHNIRAVLNSTTFSAADLMLTQTVNNVSDISVVTSGTPSVFSNPVTFTATVTGMVGTPTGTVTFTNVTTGAVLGTVGVNGSGVAQLTTTALPAGSFTIRATYNGDFNYRGDIADVAQVVNRKPLVAVGTVPGAPTAVNVYDPLTGAQVFSLPLGALASSVKVAVGDVNNDGYNDVIVMLGQGGFNGVVGLFSGLDFGLMGVFSSFPGFAGELNVTAGDVDGNGTAEIIVGTGTNFDAVLVYSGTTLSLMSAFSAFAPFFGPFGFRGGITVAAGDVNGDGRDDIIVGAKALSGLVTVNDGLSGGVLASFLLPVFPGGLNVAAGDLNGDGRAEVIAGIAVGIPAVVVFDGLTQASSVFVAFGGAPTGVSVSTVDRDGDGLAELLVAATSIAPFVQIFSGLSFSPVSSIMAVTPGLAPSPGATVAGSL
jgi:fibronectin-binding autotransporter adhesin